MPFGEYVVSLKHSLSVFLFLKSHYNLHFLNLLTVRSVSIMSQSTASPPWLNEESHEPLQSVANKYGSEVNSNPSNQLAKKSMFIFWVLKVVTILLCILMFVTALYGLRKFTSFAQIKHLCLA